MASQHQNIDGSSIEHSQIQQNQAGRDDIEGKLLILGARDRY